ncbi:MAG: hypothetical protein E7382_05990 [Clostridiales bacterium]|nr:hypothetical protein [Clostridiales bacterium]
MQDFNEFASNNKNNSNFNPNAELDQNILNLVSSLAGKFDGKSQQDLIKAIYEEARRGKKRGTLSNNDIDNFASMLAPLLDDKKKKLLKKIVEELKRI